MIGQNSGRVALVAVLLAACTSHPPETCFNIVDRSAHGGIPTLAARVNGRDATLGLDTGWYGLSFEPERRPDLQGSGAPAAERYVWGKKRWVSPLRPLGLQIGGLNAQYSEADRQPEGFFGKRYRVDGLIGSGALATLAGELDFFPPARACLLKPPCKEHGKKPWTAASDGSSNLLVFFDTGTTRSRMLRSGDHPADVQLSERTVRHVEGLTPYMRNRVFRGASMGGRHPDVVIGWDIARTLRWRWNICGGTVTFPE